MSTAPRMLRDPASAPDVRNRKEKLPPLEQGDHLDQNTFHARYEAMPQGTRAELIGGVVYMPSPLKVPHGRSHPMTTTWLTLYAGATPGTEVMDNATTILGDDSEPQPDNFLLILPEHGGQTKVDEHNYVTGAPELMVEVASSSESYDMHSKKRDYEKAGVQEYVVVLLRQEQVAWFIRRGEHFERMEPGSDGIFRSECFGGLWLDPQSIFRRDTARLQEVLQQGLASPEHARTVERLQQARANKS